MSIVNPKLSNSEKLKLINYIKSIFETKKEFNGNAMFLLPDGTFLDAGDAHLNCTLLIEEYLKDEGFIVDNDEYETVHLDNNYSENELGFIHCGNTHYRYVGIGKYEPTSEQYNSLNSVEDYFIQDESGISIETYCEPYKETTLYYDEEQGCLVNKYNIKISLVNMIKRFYNTGSFKIINESTESSVFKLGTAGYVKEDGSYVFVDEYHGEDSKYRDLGLPEFSNTHAEDDTCIRIYKEPNELQYQILEEIIDKYLDVEGYCKIELWTHPLGKYYFYKIYSLYEGSCSDTSFEEIEGNWTGYKLVQIIKNNIKRNAWDPSLNESLITEATRAQLINQSKQTGQYKDGSGNRWTAKNNCKIANTVSDYNKIDMDTFFKKDILKFGIRVEGETDTYIVTILFKDILKQIQTEVKNNKNKLDPKIIYDALMRAITRSDVLVGCTCPDYNYRFRYWATKNGYNAGQKETRVSNLTNPDNDKGAACKHILAVLNNAEWLKKIASVINNYINYCKDHMEYNYSRFIFPKIYNMNYEKAVQMTFDDYDESGEIKDDMKSDEEIINLSNALGKVRGRFKKGSNKNPVTQQQKK